jgi:hypothetical protein
MQCSMVLTRTTVMIKIVVFENLSARAGLAMSSRVNLRLL